MAAEEKPAAQGTTATVVATAAVTLAIGITAAALGGYLVPPREVTEKVKANVSEPALAEARRVEQPSAANVMLVPVAPDLPSAPAGALPAPVDEVHLATYEPSGDHDGDHDDHHRGRKHGDREHEDDDDHHDED